MRPKGFHALFPQSRDAFDQLFTPGTAALFVEVTTKSGRTFRYDLSDYRFGPDLKLADARTLAERIAAEKYKYSEWDRQHPRVVAEAEIADAVYDLILEAVARMQAGVPPNQ